MKYLAAIALCLMLTGCYKEKPTPPVEWVEIGVVQDTYFIPSSYGKWEKMQVTTDKNTYILYGYHALQKGKPYKVPKDLILS